MAPSIIAIIPTYNEPDHLAKVVESIEAQGISHLTTLVVNAGAPLPMPLGAKVTELQVPADHFWTQCVQVGFDWVQERSFDLVILINADTEFLPGTLRALVDHATGHPNTVAAAPAYQTAGDGSLELLYSHQADWGILFFGKLIKPWSKLEDAPSAAFPIELTGGQGVMFPADWLGTYELDQKSFPHTGSDHDLWLRMRRDGIKLFCVPVGGIVNRRMLGTRTGSLAKTLWYRMTSENAHESYKIMWRLRRKHLSFPVAMVSFAVSFGLRWTLGFPKILRRS